MPSTYEIFKDLRLVIVTTSGPANSQEIIEMLTHMYADPDFSSAYDYLWDARGRTEPFSIQDTKKTESHVVKYKGTDRPKRAFLVSKDVDYGMGRVYESLRHSRSDVDIEIFRDREEALKWLGVQDHPMFRSGKYSE